MRNRQESGRFFEKKRRKKLLVIWSREFRAPTAKSNQSFFAIFCSQKVVLSSSSGGM